MIPHIELSFLNIYEIEIFITNAVQGYYSGNMNVQNKNKQTINKRYKRAWHFLIMVIAMHLRKSDTSASFSLGCFTCNN